jgi:hypothetical protein
MVGEDFPEREVGKVNFTDAAPRSLLNLDFQRFHHVAVVCARKINQNSRMD